jgi:cyanophycin synthetase
MTDVVPSDIIQATIQAVRLLSWHISGVDIVSTDIRVPWHQNGEIINEVNYAPLLGGSEISLSYSPKFFKDTLR